MNRTLYRLFLLAAFCLFQTLAAVGQQLTDGPKAVTATTSSCGTDEYHQQRMLTDTAYLRFVQNAKMSGRYQLSNQGKGDPNTAAIPGDNSILTIPVVFVVYHLGEPVGQGSNVPDAALQGQINLLNKQYATTSGSTDTRIRFELAKHTAEGAAFSGIFRADGRSVPGYEALGVAFSNNNMQEQLHNLAGPAINQMSERTIIVRVFWRVTGAGGWATYGGEVEAVGTSSMNYGQGYNSLLAHEVGHVLFLRHTFQGGNGNTCPPNTNPLLDGDEVADTPPHRQQDPANGCSSLASSQINSCTGQPFGTIAQNIMSYGCATYVLTPGQADRMRGFLGGSLSRFVDSPYLFPPTPGQVPVTLSCIPTSGVATTAVRGYQNEGIREVRLGTYQRQTVHYGYQPLLYQPFDKFGVIPVLQPGQSYTITIDAPFNNLHRRAYVDWNNNGSFEEATELAFSTSIGDDFGLINVPLTATTMQALRVRVVVCDGAQPPTACYVPTKGAAHDFVLRVEATNTLPPLRLGQLNSLSYCTGQSVLLPYTFNTEYNLNALPVQAELSDESGTFSAPLLLQTGTGGLLVAQLPPVLTPGVAYRIRLTASGLPSVQTPALTIRQTPSGYLTTPTTTTTITGRPIPLSLVLSGSTSWSLAGFIATELNGSNLEQTAGTAIVPLSVLAYDLGLTRYELGTIEANNGCQATSLGGPQTLIVICAPPESLTETEQGTTWVRLGWENLSYRNYHVQWKATTALNWINLPTQQYVGAYLSNLVAGVAYEWRVAIGCPNSQTSVFSLPRSFTVGCPVPAQLFESLSHNTAIITWSQMGNSFAELRWRVAGNTAWNTVSVSYTNQWTLPNPVAGGVYEWQVRNNCGSGAFSGWAPLRTFTIGCGVPQTTYVTNISSTTAQIGWWPTMAGLQYQVRWRVQDTSNWTLVGPVASSTIALSGLPSGNFVEYGVQSICTDGSMSAYSTTSTFYVACTPLALATVSGVAATSALLSYTPQVGYRYSVSWRPAGNSSWNYTPADTPPVSAFALKNLQYNTTYEYRMEAITAVNYFCNTTPTGTFTTTNCPPPGLSSFTGPTTVISELPFSMTALLTGSAPWAFTLSNGDSFTNISTSPFSFTTQYQLPTMLSAAAYDTQIMTLSNACGTVYYPSSPNRWISVNENCFTLPANLRFERMTGSATAYLTWTNTIYAQHRIQWRLAGSNTWTTVTQYGTSYYLNFTAGQTYEWRVEAFCDYGQSGYTAIQIFTAPTCPEPVDMRESTSSTSARLVWWYIGVAASQMVRWRQVGQTTWNTVSNLYDGYTINNLTPNTAYEWQVQAVCSGGGGSSGFTLPRSFTAICDTPQRPPGFSGTSSTSTVAVLSVLPGLQYTLRYRSTTGPGSWLTYPSPFTATTATTISVPLTGLTPSTGYDVQVQAVCPGGQRTPFSESSFNYTNCQSATATLGSNTTISPGQSATLALMYVGSSPLSATINTGTSFLYASNVYSSPYPVVVSPASTTAYTLERVSNNCGVGVIQGGSTTVTVEGCTTMQTVMAGYWANPAIWSCGRVPTLTDVVTLRHAVTMSGPAIWPALGIRYAPGGQLFYQPNAQLRANR